MIGCLQFFYYNWMGVRESESQVLWNCRNISIKLELFQSVKKKKKVNLMLHITLSTGDVSLVSKSRENRSSFILERILS